MQFGGKPTSERFHGFGDNVYAACLSITNPSSDFQADATWITGDFSKFSQLETGIAYGYPKGARRYYYWTEIRPTYTPAQDIIEHDDTADVPSLNRDDHSMSVTPRADEVSYYIGSGPFTGISSGWPKSFGFNTLFTGSETTAYGGAANYVGGTDAMKWVSQNDNYVNGWSYGQDATYDTRNPADWGFTAQTIANSHYTHGVATSC